jgi:hypothetical protein
MTSDKAYAVEQRLNSIISGVGGGVIPPDSMHNPFPVSQIGPIGVVNLNPYFQGGSAFGWFAFNCTNTVTNSPPAGGPYAWALQVAVTGAGGHAYESDASTSVGNPTVMPCNGGQGYLVTAWVYSSYTIQYLGITFQNPSGTNIANIQVEVDITASTWQQVSAVITAPVNAILMQPFIGTDNGQVVYVEGVIVQPQVPGGLIQTGTIEAVQLDSAIIVGGIVDGTAINASQQITISDGPLLNYGSTATYQKLTGSGNWTPPAGVTSVQVWAFGAGGGNPGVVYGAGGAEMAYDNCVVTPTTGVYAYSCGTGGTGDGPSTTFGPDDVALTVTAHGGKQAVSGGGAGGNGSTNAAHFYGGQGGHRISGGTAGAGGGGGAGSSGSGVGGGSAGGSTGAPGGAGGRGLFVGGKGGGGGNNGAAGSAGATPGGGAGGDGNSNSTTHNGGDGVIWLLYTTGTEKLINSIAPVGGTDPNPPGGVYNDGVRNYNPAFGTGAGLAGGTLAMSSATGTSNFRDGGGIPWSSGSRDTNIYDVMRRTVMTTATQAISTVNPSFVNVNPATGPGLSTPVGIGTYIVDVYLVHTDATNTTTPRFQFTGPATSLTTAQLLWYKNASASTFASVPPTSLGPYAGPVQGATTDHWGVHIRLSVTFTASGTLQLQANISAAGSYTIAAGAEMSIYPVTAP